MSKLRTMRDAIAEFVADGASVALGLQMEQMIPCAAGQEIIRQQKRGLTLIGPISDILFDQMIGGGCAEQVIAAWVGNVMMGSAYNFRRAVEQDGMKIFNMTNFTIALALQGGAMGIPFLPTRTALGSDIPKGNHFFYHISCKCCCGMCLRSASVAGAGILQARRRVLPPVSRADEDESGQRCMAGALGA
jgi:glutaconate CoA-transferase, subunit A